MGAIQFTDRATAVRSRPETRTLAQAAVAALPAPSIFNSQPWRWRISDEHAELRADRARQLRSVDPDGRMLVVSCGIALHHALTALAARGAQAQVERIPERHDPDLLARVRVLGVSQPDPAALRLNAVMAVRRTDRRPFAEASVCADKLERVRAAAESAGAHLHLLHTEDISGMTVMAARAAAAEIADPSYRAELSAWTHRGEGARDGIDPARSCSADGVARPVPLRDFLGTPGASALESSPAGFAANATLPDAPGTPVDLADRCARYAVLFTDTDDLAAWLAAGEALSAVLLTAACEGLAASPMSDLVEVPYTRWWLRRLLAGVGHPVIAVRIGVAADGSPGPTTPRRAAEEIIELVDRPSSEQSSRPTPDSRPTPGHGRAP